MTTPTTIPYGDERDWTPPDAAFTPHGPDCLACGGPGWRTTYSPNGELLAQECQGVPQDDPVAIALAAGDREDIERALTDLANVHMLWAEIAANRARHTAASDPDIAEFLRSKKAELGSVPEGLIGQLSRWRVGLSDGRTVRVRASDEQAATEKALRRAHRRGPLGLLGNKPAPQVVSVAQVA